MKVNVRLWLILAAFFVLADIAYVIWNVLYDLQDLATDPSGGEGATRIEWVGTVALALSAVLSLLIAFYLRRVSVGAPILPEDRNDAEIDDGEAEQGFFSPHSWWPVTLAAGLTLVFVGLAVGIWLSIFGAPIAVIAIVGWIYQYYRGFFAH